MDNLDLSANNAIDESAEINSSSATNEKAEEQNIFDKIIADKAMIDQLKRMIEENLKQIELGNDVQARTNMILVLSNEMNNLARELEILQKQ